ncbi:MAG: LptF/LptG family permease [Rhodobacteraceae bacterium]|nr:LptF/LptG family permease [Paracoccaceae bacterium]
MMFVLLTVAIAIDLTKNLEDVRQTATAGDRPFAPLLLEYLGYRAMDIVTRLLPMASLAGAFLAELLRHQRMENVIFAAAGAGPGLVYAALLAVGLVLGSVQAGLEGWLRPAAIWAQVDLGLGAYADRFRRGEMGPEWFTDETRAIRAMVLRSDTPELRDIMVFEGIHQETLSRITYAACAVPGEAPQEWVLTDVIHWEGEPGAAMKPVAAARESMAFPLLPAHLEYHRVLGFYLPNGPLKEVAGFRELARWADAETAVARRFLAVFLPGVFAFLGASLSQAGRSGRLTSWWRLLPLGALGYVTLVSVKSFWALGEFGVLLPWVSAGAPLVFAFLLACFIQTILSGRLPRLRRRRQACGPRAVGREC